MGLLGRYGKRGSCCSNIQIGVQGAKWRCNFCNGKQDVDIETDGQLTAAYGGTCVQNGYENGVQSGEALKIVRA